jgi:hypothetical protein
MRIDKNRNTPIPDSRCKTQDHCPGPPREVKYSRGLTMVVLSPCCPQTLKWM